MTARRTDDVATREARQTRAAVLRRAMPSFRRRLPGLSAGVVADACVIGLLAVSLWLIVSAGAQPPILTLTFAIVGVRALAIGRAAFRYLERLASHDAAFAQLAVLRSETFDALIPRVPGALEDHRQGDVLSTFVDDIDQLQDQQLRVRQPLTVSAIVVVLSVLIVAWVSPAAAAILGGAVICSGALAVWLASRVAGRSDREVAAARGALTDALLERFASAEVLAAFDATAIGRDRITAAQHRLSRVQLRRTRSAGLTAAILSLTSGLASLGILLVLAPTVGIDLTPALFGAVVIVPVATFEVFAQWPVALAARRVVAASADRVAALTQAEIPVEIPVDRFRVSAPSAAESHAFADGDPTRHDPDPRTLDAIDPDTHHLDAVDPGVVEIGAVDPSASAVSDLAARAPIVAVRGLSARYPGATDDAFSDVSFSLGAGETLVVTGESGAGKSSLALALVRFLESRGEFVVRGRDARGMTGAQVRAEIGLCEQTPHLFDADLRQNLKFAHDTASDAELLAVLDRVGLGAWTAERGGLDAPVGEHGALVSGGQAQRIALARAILADFPVVILDEPTAGVDHETAAGLLADLVGAVPDDRAVVLITHTGVPAGVQAQRLHLT